MRARRITGALVAVMMLGLIPAAGSAQPGRGPRAGRGMGYDPQTVVTVEGRVTAENRYERPGGAGHGVHLTLESAREILDVHLGPSWYIDQQPTRINVGDRVRITGSRVTFQGRPAIVAASVVRGGDVLHLRDPQTGAPNWSRGRGARP